MFPREFKN